MELHATPEEIQGAHAYESLLVPALFQEWAPKVADAANVRSGSTALDIACGTGVLTRELASRAAANGSVTGIDPGAGMLTVAREITPEILWIQGAAEALPFDDSSFDAVTSQFGMMFFNDKPAAIREAVRVLKPGGRLAIAVWDSADAMPAYAAEINLIERLAGMGAANGMRAPFAMGDSDELASVFADAGRPDVKIETQTGTATFPTVTALLESDLRGWLPLLGINLDEDLISRILAEAPDALSEHVTVDGRLQFSSSAHIATIEK